MRRVVVVFGTRPEAIKLAPVIRELQRAPGLETVIVATAQHREMLDQVLDLFGIRPDHDLQATTGPNLAELTARMLERLAAVFAEQRFDAAIVQGDTTTTFVGALAAFYEHVPVFHVEAGLRTYRHDVPFPEEVNRRLTSHLAELHLAPTPWARANLVAERIPPESVMVTGNTGIDALHWAAALPAAEADPALARLDGDDRRILLVTAHRRESWAGPLSSIAAAVADLARTRPDMVVVFPVHKNRIVRNAVVPILGVVNNVVLLEPLAYGSFVHLMARAYVILTDSGGIQEEAPSLGKPVLVMRDVTERPEAVVAGTSRLVGTDRRRLVEEVARLFDDLEAYDAMAMAVNPYGDGRAAERTLAAIRFFFGDGPPATPFQPTVALGEISLTESGDVSIVSGPDTATP